MDFSAEVEYSPEQEAFAEEVRAWMEENVPKDLTSPRDPLKVTHAHWLQRRELGRRLGKKGWLHPRYPREYGGAGLDGDLAYVLVQELGARGIGLPPYHDAGGGLGAAALMAVGTEQQRRRLLPPILTGEAATWQLFTEPEAGTDEANQQTNALRIRREKEYFVVNGQKIFVGGLWEPPEQFLLLTRTDPDAPRHKNLAMFICPARVPGVTIMRLDLFVPTSFNAVCGVTADGADGIKYQVFFDEVKIHESCLIKGDHDGWEVTSATLAFEHGVTARPGAAARARSVHVPKNMVAEKFLAHCRENPVTRRRLQENPQLCDRVVDTYMSAQIERLFHLRNIGGKGGAYGGPQLMNYTKFFAARLSADMAAVLGHFSLTDDQECTLAEGIFEVGHRAAVAMAPGGTPEAMKILMARALGIGR